MVTFDERMGWLLLGCVLGYLAHFLQTRLMANRPDTDDRGEGGFMRIPLVADVALVIVLAITVFAAFKSQSASNQLADTQNRLEQITVCNQQYLGKTIRALNERTTYSTRVAESNVNLQQAQSEFLNIAGANPPKTEAERRDALKMYREVLGEFVVLNTKQVTKADLYPYPKPEELSRCLNDVKE